MREERRESALEIQERDFALLLGLYECRVMALRHVCELYFEGRMEAAKKRLQKLKAGGYVRERPRLIGEPSVLHLSKKAFIKLQRSGRLERFPTMAIAAMEKRSQVSDLTLRHELEVMDVRTAFLKAVDRQEGISATEFSTWPALHQFSAEHVSPLVGRRELVTKPDGFIRLREEEGSEVFERMFFLEVDRSTEAQHLIAQKAACYLDFYQKGGMAERFGAPREEFRRFPFRVLMVFLNEERRNNAAERLLQNSPPILTQVWLTTFPEIMSGPLSAIWMRPKDYLSITQGTPFDPERRRNLPGYRRQVERETRVASLLEKKRLMEE